LRTVYEVVDIRRLNAPQLQDLLTDREAMEWTLHSLTSSFAVFTKRTARL
jgi:hypothetical protein